MNCPHEQCTHSYIGETARRLKERILDQSSRDKNSACLRHSKNTGHPYVKNDEFKILSSDHANYKKRKISEALFIKEQKPSLNEQVQSTPLSL